MKPVSLELLRAAVSVFVIVVMGTVVARGQTTTRESNHEAQAPAAPVARTAMWE